MSIEIIQASLSSTDTRILKLYNQIKVGELVLRPFFQRKLVWKKIHKYHFIETILKNYPFPEIYISTGSMDTSKLTSIDWVVDGQQRLSTIYDYISSEGDFKSQNVVKPFNELSSAEQEIFLSYKVVVRDLGKINIDTIQEIFKRINNTEYSLNTNEKMNASYHNNSFMIFCKQLVDEEIDLSQPFVQDNNITLVSLVDRKKVSNIFKKVFNDNDIRRMNDLQFIMTLVISLELGYFNRRGEIDNYLDKYNEDYPSATQIKNLLLPIIDFIERLSLNDKSYWFNKANIFTMIIELSKMDYSNINISLLKERLEYIDEENKKFNSTHTIIDEFSYGLEQYFMYAKEAVNDKKSRIIRGEIFEKILLDCYN
ncbi:hypothetical protein CRU87_08995 [Aliarcobacter trophiarum LMG 25534]|uniref:DUF262 domain-containing protein n=1 Tax=Aliarcobacter trophiarum LMG 25534 TaxID=1032241 RepID=A0AAD0QIE3_9BACT|nr:DUF262 domain-containing protein [Aliarcobacter trophiarum]AXK48448.1 DUF262 domain-containing protein [Aliarcobacter trophiarum LMG 25534]RXJ89577.1 hypothetical protein CRU87_08995 [Aliarcobacter trophiarum LMG 25534]